MSETQGLKVLPRGVPLVATAGRWAVAMAAIAAVFVVLEEVYRSLTHRRPWVPSTPVAAVSLGVVAALCWWTLLAEEARLARELRTARSGTPALRAMFAARRVTGSLFTRVLQTTLGTAAVLLADGSRSEALVELGRGSPLMRGGRLERLRYLVEADLERATGARASLEESAQKLRAARRIGNREADLYGMHVRVKVLLELGDVDGSRELTHELVGSRDEEERTYLVWLRVWFDLETDGSDGRQDPMPQPISEGELRMAMLLARAHGAEKLVEKLAARLAAIAHEVKGE